MRGCDVYVFTIFFFKIEWTLACQLAYCSQYWHRRSIENQIENVHFSLPATLPCGQAKCQVPSGNAKVCGRPPIASGYCGIQVASQGSH